VSDLEFNIVLSVFDFILGPFPLLFDTTILTEEEAINVSLTGQLAANKVREQGKKSNIGIFLPFPQLNRVGFVYLFQYPNEPGYSTEAFSVGSISFLVSLKYTISFFSLIEEFETVSAKMALTLPKYNGKNTTLTEFKLEFVKNHALLRDRLVIRRKEADFDEGDQRMGARLYHFVKATQKNFDKLLYGLLLPDKKLLLYLNTTMWSQYSHALQGIFDLSF